MSNFGVSIVDNTKDEESYREERRNKNASIIDNHQFIIDVRDGGALLRGDNFDVHRKVSFEIVYAPLDTDGPGNDFDFSEQIDRRMVAQLFEELRKIPGMGRFGFTLTN